jgi:hypothetical protein
MEITGSRTRALGISILLWLFDRFFRVWLCWSVLGVFTTIFQRHVDLCPVVNLIMVLPVPTDQLAVFSIPRHISTHIGPRLLNSRHAFAGLGARAR